MTSIGVLQIAIFFGLILVCTKPLGAYMATRVRRPAHLPASGSAVARSAHLQGDRREGGGRAALDQYTAALLSFSIFGFLLTYLLQRAQGFLPFNPQHFNAGNVPPDLAFNTATSFVTNTNWQAYSRRSRP